MELLWHHDLGNGIYRIEGPDGGYMYLIQGEKKAALLDTGVGIGNLKEYVEALTDLPVEVFLTHGHFDHAGGSFPFGCVHVNRNDWEHVRNMTKQQRFEYAYLMGEYYHYTDWSEDDLVEQTEIDLINLEPEEVIDLGGRSLTVIAFSGHTHGSVAFYDDNSNFALA